MRFLVMFGEPRVLSALETWQNWLRYEKRASENTIASYNNDSWIVYDVLSDTIVNHLVLSIDEKQSFLEMTNAIEEISLLFVRHRPVQKP